MTKLELDNRSAAAKRAISIVKKFPQIEQNVLAPLLAKEIGMALLDWGLENRTDGGREALTEIYSTENMTWSKVRQLAKTWEPKEM